MKSYDETIDRFETLVDTAEDSMNDIWVHFVDRCEAVSNTQFEVIKKIALIFAFMGAIMLLYAKIAKSVAVLAFSFVLFVVACLIQTIQRLFTF